MATMRYSFSMILHSHRISRLFHDSRTEASDLLRLHFFQIVDPRRPGFKRLHFCDTTSKLSSTDPESIEHRCSDTGRASDRKPQKWLLGFRTL